MKEFDIGKWLGKCLSSSGHYNDLVGYVSDKNSLKMHIQGKTIRAFNENGGILEKKIADELPEYKGLFTNHFSDSIQFAIDTLTQQMLVVAATYIEGILNEFFEVVFTSYPERMYDYLNDSDSFNKGFIPLRDVISCQSKDDLIFYLAEKAAVNANKGKIENILKRVSALCDKQMKKEVQNKLSDIINNRNRIVHEAEYYKIESKEVVDSFIAIESLLKYLGGLCIESNIPFNDPAGIVDNRT